MIKTKADREDHPGKETDKKKDIDDNDTIDAHPLKSLGSMLGKKTGEHPASIKRGNRDQIEKSEDQVYQHPELEQSKKGNEDTTCRQNQYEHPEN